MAERPLVAHIIYSLSTGGLENGLVNIINRCPVDHYRHVIICLTQADEFAARITAPDVRVIELHKREGHDWSCYRRLWRLLRELRPAIVHSRNLAALEAQLCTLGLWGVRRVHGEHGREITDLDGSNWKYLAFRRVMRFLVDHYIAVSRDLERWLIDRVRVPSSRVSQIYNGVDFSRFAPGTVKPLALLPERWQNRGDIVLVGTVGRLTPVKDQQLLLRTLDWLRAEHSDIARRIGLVVVGDGPLRESLAAQCSELGLDEQVWFAGDRDDVPQLLGALDIFVLPSLAEGISNTILEAMASGLPVLATASGGNVELVEEGVNGGLFPVGDYRALGEALAALVPDAGQRRDLGGRAREGALERFDWDRTVQAYLSVYDRLLAK